MRNLHTEELKLVYGGGKSGGHGKHRGSASKGSSSKGSASKGSASKASKSASRGSKSGS